MATNENFDLDLQDEDAEDFVVNFGEVTNASGGTSNFNDLSNRPKYDGQMMTGETDIPKAPTKTSDLTNDSDYQTGSEVDSAIDSAIGELNIPTKTSDLENDGEDGSSVYVEASELASVATSGSYNDLENKPTIPAAQVNSDWNADSGVAQILNKPTIPTVNDATLTITQNGTSKGTFTANDADNTTIEVSDTTYSNFTGTDGVSAGTSGLVPAPATTDAGKFLKADGTWETAGGGLTPVQTTGTSTTDVMSQNATTKMIYSKANPSTYARGGAIYLGNLNTNQEQQSDPALTDRGWKYFWALPSDNTTKPVNNSVNILGKTNTGNTIVVGGESIGYGNNGTVIGGSAEAGQQSVAIGAWASAGKTGANISSMIAIGAWAQANVNQTICIGGGDSSYGIQNSASTGSVALGYKSAVGSGSNGYKNAVALGAYSRATRQGEVNVGLVTDETTGGFNNTAYRVIGGVHDGQLANDCATVGQINATIDAINTALSTNIPHIGA